MVIVEVQKSLDILTYTFGIKLYLEVWKYSGFCWSSQVDRYLYPIYMPSHATVYYLCSPRLIIPIHLIWKINKILITEHTFNLNEYKASILNKLINNTLKTYLSNVIWIS